MNPASNPLHAPAQAPMGEQLGHLEYTITPEVLAQYREALAYPEAGFPNLAAAEWREVLTRRLGDRPLVSLGHRDRYFTPPILGRRVQVSGWLRERQLENGQEWLRVETFAVDEIGTEILRTEHTFLAGNHHPVPAQAENIPDQAPGEQLPPLVKWVSPEGLALLEDLYRSLTGGHQTRDQAANFHTEQLGLGTLHELVARRFGIDFRQGGLLKMSYLRPIRAGDRLTASGTARASASAAGRVHYCLNLWLHNQRGEPTARGSARVTVPSPLT